MYIFKYKKKVLESYYFEFIKCHATDTHFSLTQQIWILVSGIQSLNNISLFKDLPPFQTLALLLCVWFFKAEEGDHWQFQVYTWENPSW